MLVPSWAIVLIGVIVFIYIRYLSYRLKKLEIYSGFEPRKIIIFPHWAELLEDYNVIARDKYEELYRKCEEDGKFTEGKYHVLNNGLIFTVLKWDEYSSLVYDNNRNQCLSRAFIREKIREIGQYDPEHIVYGNEPYHPEFYVKDGFDGFELGITTLESFDKVGMVGDNNELINVGTIPYSYIFKRHLLPDVKFKKDLEKFGWQEYKHDAEARIAGAPLQVNHKYFSVYVFFV